MDQFVPQRTLGHLKVGMGWEMTTLLELDGLLLANELMKYREVFLVSGLARFISHRGRTDC